MADTGSRWRWALGLILGAAGIALIGGFLAMAALRTGKRPAEVPAGEGVTR